MLVHQIQDSEGSQGNTVVLNDRTVSRFTNGTVCHSGIKLGNDGVLSLIQSGGGFSAVGGEWLVVGSVASFYVRHQIISGTLETEPTENVWNQLTTNRIYDNIQTSIGQSDATVLFEIAEDAGGASILATATMTFQSENSSS